jgi:hypothetical protein
VFGSGIVGNGQVGNERKQVDTWKGLKSGLPNTRRKSPRFFPKSAHFAAGYRPERGRGEFRRIMGSFHEGEGGSETLSTATCSPLTRRDAGKESGSRNGLIQGGSEPGRQLHAHLPFADP